MNRLTSLVVDIACAEADAGVREDPPGSNHGPRVEEYQSAVPGGEPGDSWCAEFVFWCFRGASWELILPNPMPPTRSALHCYRDAPGWARTDKPAAGAMVVFDHGGGKGHVEIVVGVYQARMLTVGGNTNAVGARNGDGVHRHNNRSTEDPTIVGYVDYSREPGAVPEKEQT